MTLWIEANVLLGELGSMTIIGGDAMHTNKSGENVPETWYLINHHKRHLLDVTALHIQQKLAL